MRGERGFRELGSLTTGLSCWRRRGESPRKLALYNRESSQTLGLTNEVGGGEATVTSSQIDHSGTPSGSVESGLREEAYCGMDADGSKEPVIEARTAETLRT